MPSSLAIFVSHNGKTLQLSCSRATRVEAVQQALVALTGVPLADQIVMCEGARLDPHKPLSAYGLPVDEHDQPHDVFLYSRALLKPGASPPPDEAAPVIVAEEPAASTTAQQPHALDRASSPLLRALPEYERQFAFQLARARALAEATQLRYGACAQLVSEQEVQALSIDAARTNVEAHFSYICGAFEGFMQRYLAQHAVHAEVLGSFEEDLRFLAATELHPALQRGPAASGGSSVLGGGRGSAAGSSTGASPSASTSLAAGSGSFGSASGAQMQAPRRLIDLVDAATLRELYGSCSKSHRHYAAKVSELESLFVLLKGDVEALFMQAPSVDMEALAEQLAEMHASADEQASIVQALASDLGKVQQILEHTTAQLSGAASASVSLQLSDTCQMLETMHESHAAHLLPRAAGIDTALQDFTQRCVACKNALSKDVQHQLQCIASQQSRIREMKDKLALFGEALARQESGVGQLLGVRRLPAAYKQCLAECVRRGAFGEKYAQSAAKLAESMGRFREKEVATREAFRRHVERYIPTQLLERMGLLEQPPHCQVSLPGAAEGEQLLHVTVDELRRFQLPWSTGSSLSEPALSPRASSAMAAGPAEQQQQQRAQQEQQQQQEEQQTGDVAGAEGTFEDLTASLQMENARLRADLATAVARDCVRSVQLAGLPAPAAAAATAVVAPGGSTAPASAAAPGSAAAAEPGSSQVQQAQQGAAGAVQRYEKALAAKDELVGELQSQLGRAQAQARTYEHRILSLEQQLASLAAAGRQQQQQGASAGSGSQQSGGDGLQPSGGSGSQEGTESQGSGSSSGYQAGGSGGSQGAGSSDAGGSGSPKAPSIEEGAVPAADPGYAEGGSSSGFQAGSGSQRAPSIEEGAVPSAGAALGSPLETLLQDEAAASGGAAQEPAAAPHAVGDSSSCGSGVLSAASPQGTPPASLGSSAGNLHPLGAPFQGAVATAAAQALSQPQAAYGVLRLQPQQPGSSPASSPPMAASMGFTGDEGAASAASPAAVPGGLCGSHVSAQGAGAGSFAAQQGASRSSTSRGDTRGEHHLEARLAWGSALEQQLQHPGSSASSGSGGEAAARSAGREVQHLVSTASQDAAGSSSLLGALASSAGAASEAMGYASTSPPAAGLPPSLGASATAVANTGSSDSSPGSGGLWLPDQRLQQQQQQQPQMRAEKAEVVAEEGPPQQEQQPRRTGVLLEGCPSNQAGEQLHPAQQEGDEKGKTEAAMEAASEEGVGVSSQGAAPAQQASVPTEQRDPAVRLQGSQQQQQQQELQAGRQASERGEELALQQQAAGPAAVPAPAPAIRSQLAAELAAAAAAAQAAQLAQSQGEAPPPTALLPAPAQGLQSGGSQQAAPQVQTQQAHATGNVVADASASAAEDAPAGSGAPAGTTDQAQQGIAAQDQHVVGTSVGGLEAPTAVPPVAAADEGSDVEGIEIVTDEEEEGEEVYGTPGSSPDRGRGSPEA